MKPVKGRSFSRGFAIIPDTSPALSAATRALIVATSILEQRRLHLLALARSNWGIENGLYYRALALPDFALALNYAK